METNTMAISKVYDTGFVQRREWMLYCLRPDRAPFNFATSADLETLDLSILERSVRLVMQDNEILRTTLRLVNGRLMQVVHATGDFPMDLMYYDVSEMTGPEREGFCRTRINAALASPFDFESGPLFRILVIKRGTANFKLHVTFNHVISDVHSQKLFREEVMKKYNMAKNGLHDVSKSAESQYYKYSNFENELLNNSRGDKHRRYWEDKLVYGVPGVDIVSRDRWNDYQMRYMSRVTDVKQKIRGLPFYDERFMGSVIRRYQPEEAGELVYIFEPDIFDKFIRYVEKGRNGVLSFLVAALLRVFNRLCGQTRFVFEIVGSNRVEPRYVQTMGWLASGGPCYFNFSHDLSAEEFLEYIDQELFLLSRNCVYPFEAAGYKTDPPPGSRMPLLLILTEYPNDIDISKSGIISSKPLGGQCYQELSFFLALHKNALALNLFYNVSLFDESQIRVLLDEFSVCMEQLLKEIDISSCKIQLK